MFHDVVDNVVVICTKNRPQLLSKLLLSLGNQVRTTSFDVLIIDSSDFDLDLDQIQENLKVEFKVDVVKCDKTLSLPRKRNLSLEYLAKRAYSFVHFFDDDVVLEPQYLPKIIETFKSKQIVGVTGLDISRAPYEPSRISCLLGLDSRNSGKILASGANTFPKEIYGNQVFQIEWLPGCAMSFRLEKILDLRFDERRRFVGEDTDFTFRASKVGDLLFQPLAKYHHSSSTSNIPNSNHKVWDHVDHLVFFSIENSHKIKPWKCYVFLLANSVLFFKSSLQHAKFHLFKLSVKYLFGSFRYILLVRVLKPISIKKQKSRG